jgi:hypothetical protein
MHYEKYEEFIRIVSEYIKTVKAGAGAGAGFGIQTGITISLDPNGYPALPATADWHKTKKVDLENLYRKYMTIQYCMVYIFFNCAGNLFTIYYRSRCERQ